MTLTELLVVVALLSVVVTVIVIYSVPTIAREAMRSAVYDLQSFMQLTRIEAIKRNRPCRLVVDQTAGELRVLDGMGTPSTSDDQLVRGLVLPESVALAQPGGGSPISLESLGGGLYQAVLASNGVVSSGVGSVTLAGGEQYQRVTILGAGGVLVERWNGSGWE
jgi:type II secretory pathway pseudopilin PulG